MQGLLITLLLLAVLALAASWRLVHQLKRRHLLSGFWWSAQSLILLLLFIAILLVYSNLHTYKRLTYETDVAEIYLRKLKPQQYQLSISFSEADEDQQYYEIKGDQWQLDARILKWKSWANLIGLDSFYQFERLSGRYSNVFQAQQNTPSVYDLTQKSRGLDIWRLKQLLKDKLFFVDTLFGQGVFMPMRDGAHFRVTLGQSGLIVRPVNEAARSSVL